MLTVNLNEAKTHLARLVEQAAKGESFVITKAGKPLVKVTAIHPPKIDQTHRLGFMAGQIIVPEEFDRMGADVIDQLFNSKA